MPTFWMAYVGVDDIDESTEKAKSLGAKVERAPMEIPNVGWMSVLTYPTGAVIALFEPNQPM